MRTKFALLLMFAGAPLWAQQDAHAYAYFAPGAMSSGGVSATTFHFGGGADILLAKGIGVGAEIGALGPKDGFGDGVFGVFSPDASYHFAYDRRRKWDPFVAGGYSLFFRNGTLNAFNVGGGINYWLTRRMAFRGEFRDHIYPVGGAIHFWGFRFGMSFR